MSSYSIKDLERISGIKAHTIRIWEQRYNIVSPNRTDTNIRHYDDEDLKSLRPTLGVEWIQVHNDKRHEIKAYIRREENKPFRSFKAEIMLNANLTTLSNVLLDFPNYHKWYWKAKDVQLLKKFRQHVI